VGRRDTREGRFPERHHPTVHRPERFRGGCAFGAGSAQRRSGLFRWVSWTDVL